MREVHVTLYQLAELPDEKAKARARDYIREQVDNDDFDSEVEDCVEIAQFLGFSEVELLYSGFYTQGSGACLVGRWYACNVRLDLLKNHAPTDEALQRIGDEIDAIAKAHPHLWFKTQHRGYYRHSYSVDFDFGEDEPDTDTVTAVKDALRKLMGWCYRQLEKQNEWLNSDERLDQEAVEREYEFTADGRHWRCGPFEHPYRPCSEDHA